MTLRGIALWISDRVKSPYIAMFTGNHDGAAGEADTSQGSPSQYISVNVFEPRHYRGKRMVHLHVLSASPGQVISKIGVSVQVTECIS